MNGRTVGRWAMGVAFAGACIALHVKKANSATNPRIQVVVANTNNCPRDAIGNTYEGEAWAYDGGGTKTCEVFTTGATAMSTCAALASQHEARIDTRTVDGTLALVGPNLGLSTRQTSWTATSTFINYTIPVSSNCPSGSSMTVYSQGLQGASLAWPP